MSDITISERQTGDVTILKLDGKVMVGESSVELRKAVRRLLIEGRNRILLDLTRTSYIDSSGLGEFSSSLTAVKNEGGNMKLFRLQAKITDLLVITKLLTDFDCYDDRAEALASFGRW